MNIETKVYKAKAEKLMEEVRRLEMMLERQESAPMTSAEIDAYMEREIKRVRGEVEPGQTPLQSFEPPDYSNLGPGEVASRVGSTVAQGAVAAGAGLVGAHAVGGYVPTKVGKSLIGTPPQIVSPRPGGFSTARANKNAYDVVKGVVPYEKGAVRLGSAGSGWGTRVSEKIIRELEKPEVVNKTASRVAKAAAAFETKYNLPVTLSGLQRATAAENAAKRAERTYRAASDISQTAAKIASSPGGELATKGAKALTTIGRKALGKIVTPIGAAVSGWQAYGEFEKGNVGRGLVHSGLAVANLIPGLNLAVVPIEGAMMATEVDESYKGIEVNKKLNEIKNC